MATAQHAGHELALPLVARIGTQRLDVDQHCRQGRAQLVRRVGHEDALALAAVGHASHPAVDRLHHHRQFAMALAIGERGQVLRAAPGHLARHRAPGTHRQADRQPRRHHEDGQADQQGQQVEALGVDRDEDVPPLVAREHGRARPRGRLHGLGDVGDAAQAQRELAVQRPFGDEVGRLRTAVHDAPVLLDDEARQRVVDRVVVLDDRLVGAVEHALAAVGIVGQLVGDRIDGLVELAGVEQRPSALAQQVARARRPQQRQQQHLRDQQPPHQAGLGEGAREVAHA